MSETSLSNDSVLLNREFAYNGVAFRVQPLGPKAALAVLEYVRVALSELPTEGGALATFFSEPDVVKAMGDAGFPPEYAAIAMRIVNMVLSTPPALVDRLMADMFRSVSYRTQDMSDFAGLYGMEDDAFAGIPVVLMYAVMGRAACVNFYDSGGVALSLLSGLLGSQ